MHNGEADDDIASDLNRYEESTAYLVHEIGGTSGNWSKRPEAAYTAILKNRTSTNEALTLACR